MAIRHQLFETLSGFPLVFPFFHASLTLGQNSEVLAICFFLLGAVPCRMTLWSALQDLLYWAFNTGHGFGLFSSDFVVKATCLLVPVLAAFRGLSPSG